MVRRVIVLAAVLALLVGLVIGWLAHGPRAPDLGLAPVQQSLAGIDAQLRAVEASRQRAYGGLTEQVAQLRLDGERLRSETGRLVTALRAPQTRGRWGELQLRRVVESAGALEHCHFSEQVTSADGRHRPDLVVHLADGKDVAVDSKVPLLHWLAAMEAPDKASRDASLAAHARAVRGHVKELADKAYWSDLAGSPELVVLFLPADAFLDAALAQDPTLLEDAFARGVVPATPGSLVALLRTVAFGWRTERLSESAAQIGQLGRDLYERLGIVGAHLDKLGRSLTGAVGAYNTTVGSLESRVLVTARRMVDLGVGDELLPVPGGVTEGIRPLAAPELTDRLTTAERLRDAG
jgi:DNA recombination protein RmuC